MAGRDRMNPTHLLEETNTDGRFEAIRKGMKAQSSVWSTGTVAQRWSAKPHHFPAMLGGSALRSTTPYDLPDSLLVRTPAANGHAAPALWIHAGGLLALILLSTLVSGCRHTAAEAPSSVSSVPEVHVVKPQRRNLTCTVEQPGFVQAYEETAIYSKVSGFIKHYYVDIGQQVKKGDLLVEVFVPELDESHQQTVAQIELDRKMVEQARQLVVVAQSKLQTTIAQLAEAKANVGKYQADIVRWESEVQRLTKMVEQRVVDREVLDETQKQLSSSRAACDAALAAVAAREAAEVSSQADVGKAKIDVDTAKAQVTVAEAEERRTAAMLAYTKVTAPYDGVVTVRNANTGDYVQAASGDKSTSRASPMFVVARDDKVRIFVDVPEAYARYVHEGTKAEVRADALSGLEIKAAVTRTSWSLAEKTRTLWVEIDLPTRNLDFPNKNPVVMTKAKVPTGDIDPPKKYSDTPTKSVDFPAKSDNGLRPGMYVNTTVIIQRVDVPVLPQAALVVTGNETYCYLLKDGKAVKTSVVPGLHDGPWVEVTKMKIGDLWARVSGDEDVIMGSLDELNDGEPVKVVKSE